MKSKAAQTPDESGTDGRTSLSQSSSHSVLSGEDVTGRPATLSPQRTQSLNQHLQETKNKTHTNFLTVFKILLLLYNI